MTRKDGKKCFSHIDSLFKYRNCTVVLLYVGRPFFHDYYNAYTLLPRKPKKELINQTWGCKSREAGIDTAHWENDRMTIKELKENAIKQIKELIDDFYKKERRGESK